MTPQPIYDEKTKRFRMAEAEAKAKEDKKKTYTPIFRVGGDMLAKLAGFAKEDGFNLTRKDKSGKQVEDTFKLSQAIGLYVGNAVVEFIKAREAVEQAPEPTPEPAQTK